MSVQLLPKTQRQQFALAQPARPLTPQVTRVYLQPPQAIAGSTWAITMIDAAGQTHIAGYESLLTDGQTEIIDGILRAFHPFPPDEFFNALVVTANYDLRTLNIVSTQPITVQAAVTPPFNKWDLVPFPYALAEPVIRGAYGDGLREAGQTDKAVAEEQAVLAEHADRMTKALVPGYTDLTDTRAPAPRYRGKLAGQGPTK